MIYTVFRKDWDALSMVCGRMVSRRIGQTMLEFWLLRTAVLLFNLLEFLIWAEGDKASSRLIPPSSPTHKDLDVCSFRL